MKRFSAVAMALLAWSTAAWADAVDVSLNPKAELGKGFPTVHVRILEPIAGFELKLKRSDGQPFGVQGGGKPGITRHIELPQPEGAFRYEGELTVHLPDASTASMPLKFDTELWGPVRLEVHEGDLDLKARRLVFRLSRRAGKAGLTVMSQSGLPIYDGEIPFKGEAPGTPLTVTWPESAEPVMKIELKGYDLAGFYRGIELYPWRFDVPHREVNFETGRAEIRPQEKSKLEESYRAITDAVLKFGRFAKVRLFVVGHTDTVASKESNRTLSVQRARSLGTYFKGRGLRIPVLYAGYGEEALVVKTEDEVDEPRNRRAEYIIAVENPKVEHASSQLGWNRL